MPPKRQTNSTSTSTRSKKQVKVEDQYDSGDEAFPPTTHEVETRNWQSDVPVAVHSETEDNVSEDEVAPVNTMESASVTSTVSVVDFDYQPVRDHDKQHLSTTDTMGLLKTLIVRGFDSHNPALWGSARRLLQQLHFEHIPRQAPATSTKREYPNSKKQFTKRTFNDQQSETSDRRTWVNQNHSPSQSQTGSGQSQTGSGQSQTGSGQGYQGHNYQGQGYQGQNQSGSGSGSGYQGQNQSGSGSGSGYQGRHGPRSHRQ